MKTNFDQLHKTLITYFRFHRHLILVQICLSVWESSWEPVLYFEFYQWFDPFIHGDITLFMRASLKVVFSWGTASGFPASACLVFWRRAAGAVFFTVHCIYVVEIYCTNTNREPSHAAAPWLVKTPCSLLSVFSPLSVICTSLWCQEELISSHWLQWLDLNIGWSVKRFMWKY